MAIQVSQEPIRLTIEIDPSKGVKLATIESAFVSRDPDGHPVAVAGHVTRTVDAITAQRQILAQVTRGEI